MSKQWLRLYKEISTDLKLKRVTPQQRWFWVHLLCLALDNDGVVRLAPGVGFTVEELAGQTDLTVDEVRSAETAFETLQMLTIDQSRVMRIRNWDRRQFASDYSTERVRRFRARQTEADAKRDSKRERNVSVTPPDQNRTEQNRTEQKGRGFAPPTENEVAEYARSKGYKIDAEKFVSYHESNGWRVGKNPMKDWRRAMTTWWINDGRPLLRSGTTDLSTHLDAEARQHAEDSQWLEYQRDVIAGRVKPGFAAWKETKNVGG